MTEYLVASPLESRLEVREIRGTIGVMLPVHELQRFNDLFKTGDLVDDRLLHFNVNLNLTEIASIPGILARGLLVEHLEVTAEALPLAEKGLAEPTENSRAFLYFTLSKCCRHQDYPAMLTPAAMLPWT